MGPDDPFGPWCVGPHGPHPDGVSVLRVSPEVRAWLPSGRSLADTETEQRHRIVCVLLAAHCPVLLGLALATGRGAVHATLALVVPLLTLALALGPWSRRRRALAASAGLLASSTLLVDLGHNGSALHFHVFVVVALVALYQDWAVLALAVATVAGGHELLALLSAGDPAGHRETAAGALVRTGFVLAEAGVLAVFWRAGERARHGEAVLQAALWEGQASVRARLEETERIRTDLIGTVSHEFRTPLTAIRGTALTLLKRGERLDGASRQALLKGLLEQQERLSRLLENMLTAARATAADASALAEVDAVAAEVAMLAGATRPGCPDVSVVVEPGILARIDRHALHQVLANLVDNAQEHGSPGAVPLVAGGTDGSTVWIAVSNEGGPLDVTAARSLFDPFTQGDTSATRSREGLGMGLYVVRRLIEVYGGTVGVRAEGGWVTVEIRLASAGRQTPAPTALPTAYVRPAAAPPSRS